MYAHAHVKSLIPTHLDNCPSTRCKALCGSGIDLYSNPTDIIHPRWDYFQRKSLVDIGFLSNFAADISIMVFFLYYRCLLFFSIGLPHIGRFLYPHISPIPPPIGRPPPASTVRGGGVFRRYLNDKQLGLSKKIPEKFFVKISEVTLIFL